MNSMRILLTSAPFHPSIGGIETASHVLAHGLSERGHDVTVVTLTPGDTDGYPYKVVRRPGGAALLRLVQKCDLMWQNHISLRLLWPILLVPRPLLIMHHIWLDSNPEAGTQYGAFKRLACMLGRNVFVSSVLRDAARLPGPIIPNSYDEATFRLLPGISRDRDVAFLGRFVTFKGTDTVIDALGQLAGRNRRFSATMIGVGPQADALKERAAAAGIAAQVEFPGPLQGEALARMLNRHRVLVVPSRWEEPFGIVALEGLACGCVTVVADSGALPEVIGSCGLTVPKNDPATLAQVLDRLLGDPAMLENYRQRIPAHLAKYSRAALLDACEAAILDATTSKGRRPGFATSSIAN
jgi:glycosyltransferase involved in cell wall biosynthesis